MALSPCSRLLGAAFVSSLGPPLNTHINLRGLGTRFAAASGDKWDTTALKQCLKREYTNFFNPMEVEFYDENVAFVDPLTSLSGVDSYRNNVDLLAGRTLLGSLLFKDAGIDLHSVVDIPGESHLGSVRTRWTLHMTVKLLPWQPTAYFTGVSIYEISPLTRLITQQKDYWDSINLAGGSYEQRSKLAGLGDFLAQLSPANPERLTASTCREPPTAEVVARAFGFAALAMMAGARAALNPWSSSEFQLSPAASSHRGGVKTSTPSATSHQQNRFRNQVTASWKKGSSATNAVWKQLRSKDDEARAEAATRVPYLLLRRGCKYDVRRYPREVWAAVTIASAAEYPRDRGALGAYLKGTSQVPLTPMLITKTDGFNEKGVMSTSVPLIFKKREPAAPVISSRVKRSSEFDVQVAQWLQEPPASAYRSMSDDDDDDEGDEDEGDEGEDDDDDDDDDGILVAVKRLPEQQPTAESYDEAAWRITAAAHMSLIQALAADGLDVAVGEDRRLRVARYTAPLSTGSDDSRSTLAQNGEQVDDTYGQAVCCIGVPPRPGDECWVVLAASDWN